MGIYTITLTDTEELAMSYIALSTDEWIQNAAHERARVAIDEIVNIAIKKFLETGQNIPNSKDGIVAAAFTNGWLKPLGLPTSPGP
jgi:hypothetical protein